MNRIDKIKVEMKCEQSIFNNYEIIDYLDNGNFKVQNKLGQGIIDRFGEEIIPCQYLEISNFKDNMAAVKNKNNQWGFVNNIGQEVIPCQYKATSDFNNGLVNVMNYGNALCYGDPFYSKFFNRNYK